MPNYNDIRRLLNVGVIVLFSSKDYFLSIAIQLIINSKWSQVGMVFKDYSKDIIYFLEYTTLFNIKEVEDNSTELQALLQLCQKLKNKPFEQNSLQLLNGISLGFEIVLKKSNDLPEELVVAT